MTTACSWAEEGQVELLFPGPEAEPTRKEGREEEREDNME